VPLATPPRLERRLPPVRSTKGASRFCCFAKFCNITPATPERCSASSAKLSKKAVVGAPWARRGVRSMPRPSSSSPRCLDRGRWRLLTARSAIPPLLVVQTLVVSISEGRCQSDEEWLAEGLAALARHGAGDDPLAAFPNWARM
jgi:hypothetical protein